MGIKYDDLLIVRGQGDMYAFDGWNHVIFPSNDINHIIIDDIAIIKITILE